MKNLLVVPYAFDSASPVFSHQVGVIQRLAKVFDKTIVLTGEIGALELLHNIDESGTLQANLYIQTLSPNSRSKIAKALNFLSSLNEIIDRENISVVFFFMTDTHAALASPIIKFKNRKIKQVLWYAHAHNSLPLRLAYPFLDIVLSSTNGSMPIKGEKVRLIGQMIDSDAFPLVKDSLGPISRLVYIGRFDISKNLNLIIQTFFETRKIYSELTLTLFGKPTGRKSLENITKLQQKYEDEIQEGILSFNPPIPRRDIAFRLRDFDIFIHAFQGSLDKVLVEATLCGLPVATINVEYHNIFGSWSLNSSNLHDELFRILTIPRDLSWKEILQRRVIALRDHSLENWIYRFKREVLG